MRTIPACLAALLLMGCAATGTRVDVGVSLRDRVEADYLSPAEAAEAVTRGRCRSLRTVDVLASRGAGDELSVAAGFLRGNLKLLRGNAYTVESARWVRHGGGMALVFRSDILACREPVGFASRQKESTTYPLRCCGAWS